MPENSCFLLPDKFLRNLLGDLRGIPSRPFVHDDIDRQTLSYCSLDDVHNLQNYDPAQLISYLNLVGKSSYEQHYVHASTRIGYFHQKLMVRTPESNGETWTLNFPLP